MKKLLLFLFSIYGFLVFLVLMLLIFPFVIIFSFFGMIKGGDLIYKMCTWWAKTAILFWGIKHINLYESSPPNDQSVVYVFNHTSYIDIPILLKTFSKSKIRVLAKSSMSKIPVFGFIYKKAAIMVDRSSDKARAESMDRMKAYLRLKTNIVIAPEGTFNMSDKALKEFYNGAFRVAIEMQVPVQPVIFVDAYDRLNPHSIFSLNPGKSRAVFLPQFSTANLSENDMPQLKEDVYNCMEAALIRYKASWIK